MLHNVPSHLKKYPWIYHRLWKEVLWEWKGFNKNITWLSQPELKPRLINLNSSELWILLVLFLFSLKQQTAQVGGAIALSVLLTVFCNLAAVFTVPPLVAWIINFENVRLDPVKLLIKLVLTVLLPLLVCTIRIIVIWWEENKYQYTLNTILTHSRF